MTLFWTTVLRSREEKGANFKSRKSCVLESFSNIFFTLETFQALLTENLVSKDLRTFSPMALKIISRKLKLFCTSLSLKSSRDQKFWQTISTLMLTTDNSVVGFQFGWISWSLKKPFKKAPSLAFFSISLACDFPYFCSLFYNRLYSAFQTFRIGLQSIQRKGRSHIFCISF